MWMPNGSRTKRNNCKSTKWSKKIKIEELKVNMSRSANWKSPGCDKLPNFWIKQFKSLHKSMVIAY